MQRSIARQQPAQTRVERWPERRFLRSGCTGPSASRMSEEPLGTAVKILSIRGTIVMTGRLVSVAFHAFHEVLRPRDGLPAAATKW